MTTSTSNAIRLDCPEPDTAEISLFGPGVGECVVVHIGGGDWFIVDSCRDSATSNPVALQYLAQIGVDVSQSVVGILITHWHSDHVAGISKLAEACNKANIFIPAALSTSEALHFIRLFSQDQFQTVGREIREFGKTLDLLRAQNRPERLVSTGSRLLFFDHSKKQHRSRMIALSPSPTAETQAKAVLAAKIPDNGDRRLRNAVPESPNLNAVAVYFEFGQHSALLGSDLEESGNNKTGWSAILKSGLATELDLGRAEVFKVPHHGSVTGHCEEVWTRLLASMPLSFTTPFTRSNLPNAEDIGRVARRSHEFWVTRRSKAGRRVKRASMVDREMKAVTTSRQTIGDKMGHVQVRFSDVVGVSVCGNEQAVRYSS